jgi:hypothetical protein
VSLRKIGHQGDDVLVLSASIVRAPGLSEIEREEEARLSFDLPGRQLGSVALDRGAPERRGVKPTLSTRAARRSEVLDDRAS